MPTRALRRCSYPLCGKPTSSRYCDAHQHDTKRTEAVYDRHRGSSHSRGYNSRGRWGKLRKLILARAN
jgi:hypothetical protein